MTDILTLCQGEMGYINTPRYGKYTCHDIRTLCAHLGADAIFEGRLVERPVPDAARTAADLVAFLARNGPDDETVAKLVTLMVEDFEPVVSADLTHHHYRRAAAAWAVANTPIKTIPDQNAARVLRRSICTF